MKHKFKKIQQRWNNDNCFFTRKEIKDNGRCDIRNSKNINRYMIAAKMKPYYMRNHTKGNIVETTQIGSKIEITISEGTQKNVENTSIGRFIIDDE